MARILAVPIVVFYENKTVVVAGCNATLIGAALCTVSLEDKMFEGLILILIFFGIGKYGLSYAVIPLQCMTTFERKFKAPSPKFY